MQTGTETSVRAAADPRMIYEFGKFVTYFRKPRIIAGANCSCGARRECRKHKGHFNYSIGSALRKVLLKIIIDSLIADHYWLTY
jgi:hypothetical protein